MGVAAVVVVRWGVGGLGRGLAARGGRRWRQGRCAHDRPPIGGWRDKGGGEGGGLRFEGGLGKEAKRRRGGGKGGSNGLAFESEGHV